MSEKSIWPTETRKAQLKAQGRVPYSKLATNSVKTLVLIFSSGFIFNILINSRVFNFLDYQMIDLLKILDVIVLLLVITLLTTFVIGLLQTKLMFNLKIGGFKSKRQNVFKITVCMVLAILSSLYLTVESVNIFGLFNSNKINLLAWSLKIVATVAPVLIGSLLLLALASWLLAWFYFMLSARMSDKELIEESKERSFGLPAVD